MPRLYSIHLSRLVKGTAKGPVRTVAPSGRLFDVDPSNGEMVVPDRDAIRACLPACYRKAWDRNAAMSQISGQEGFHFTLRDSRMKYINTVYAVPYDC